MLSIHNSRHLLLDIVQHIIHVFPVYNVQNYKVKWQNFYFYFTEPLTLTISPPSGTATYGDASYTIQCQITGATASSWSWTKTPINGGSTQQITQGSKYSIQNSPSNPFITINNIVEEDEADYACQATNLAGPASSSNSRLTVTGCEQF